GPRAPARQPVPLHRLPGDRRRRGSGGAGGGDPMTETVPHRAHETTRVVNTEVKRQDAREKLLGRTRYAGDFDIAGQLYAKLVRAPLPSARIVSRDATAALEVPGVVAVLFGEDVPNNEIPTNTAGIKGRPQPPSWVLATERVRYHGEP